MRAHIARFSLVSLILLLAACNLSNAAQPTPTAEPVVVVEPTAETTLTTYTNTAYNYSLEYPAGLELVGDASAQFVWIDRQIYIMVSEFNPEEPRGDAPVIERADDAMVGAYTARRLSGYIGAVGGNTPQRYEAVVIQHNNLYYTFTAYELKNDETGPIDRAMNPVPTETVALLDQIVASLRFTS
ncbi:MAG: hypothetical protein R3E39_19460 [Anaerolineae bacterium]